MFSFSYDACVEKAANAIPITKAVTPMIASLFLIFVFLRTRYCILTLNSGVPLFLPFGKTPLRLAGVYR
jgi:hypothetical protein